LPTAAATRPKNARSTNLDRSPRQAGEPSCWAAPRARLGTLGLSAATGGSPAGDLCTAFVSRVVAP
jgi:hypothetical protein